MLHIKTLKPLFTSILVTGEEYAEDIKDNGIITYKKGDSWEWTDLTTEVKDGIIAFTVADARMATEISERGLIFRGQAYTLIKITVTKGGTTNISTVSTKSQTDVAYNLMGQRLAVAKGLIIKNGKKYLVK